MSKRLLILITVVSMLVAFGSAQAQQPTAVEPGAVLTEAQINRDFAIPSTANRRISNLDVEVHEDGVYVSFQMTLTRDGKTETLNIIAILIGLFSQPRVSSLQLENTMVSSFVAPAALQREISSLVLNSWAGYEAGVLATIPAEMLPTEQGFIMSEGRICNPRWGC